VVNNWGVGNLEPQSVETLFFPELGFLKCHDEKRGETMNTTSYIE